MFGCARGRRERNATAVDVKQTITPPAMPAASKVSSWSAPMRRARDSVQLRGARNRARLNKRRGHSYAGGSGMSELNKLDEREIRIFSITAEAPPDVPGRPGSWAWAKVVFKITKNGPEFPVFVDRKVVADENLIRVARHYLHMQTQTLAELTVSWRLSDEELQQIVPPQQTPRNRGPGSIRIPT